MYLFVKGMDPPREREVPPALPPKTRTREQHSNLNHAVNGSTSEEENTNQEPPPLPVVPPRFRAQHKKDKRPVSNGLPPTPKVHVSQLFILIKFLMYHFYPINSNHSRIMMSMILTVLS